MQPDASDTCDADALRGVPGSVDRMRLRFAKTGPLRWLSHHDLLRTFERMLRRSELPFRQSQGFHPHPHIVFALSLPLGVVGRAEVVDVEFDAGISPEEVRERLQRQCPEGMDILDAQRLPAAVGVHVVGLCYGLTIPAQRIPDMQLRAAALLEAGECWVERRKPTPRRLDLRPLLRNLRLDPATGWLEIDLWLTSAGTARPDEILGLLQARDLVEDGVVVERVRLDMKDDCSPPAGQA